MPRLATWALLTSVGLQAFAQGILHWPNASGSASPGWPFGPPHNRPTLEGTLAHADEQTLSIELRDRRVVRFRLNDQTRYDGHAAPKLEAFKISDLVEVKAEVDSQGDLDARSVRYLREASPEERSELLECPEVTQQWRDNLLGEIPLAGANDDRRLSLVSKPGALSDFSSAGRESDPLHHEPSADDVIPLARRAVQDAFERLPNFRAKQVTSMFHSGTKPVKWVPDGVVAAEIAYEENHELYSDIRKDGRQPANAPQAGDSDYMRSLDIAWSTGDFETISHCVFSELADSDFRKAGIEHASQGDLVLYEFARRRPSSCIALKFKAEIAYPGFKGSITIDPRTHDVVHVELEATEIPFAFPLDRAERSLDLETVRIGSSDYRLPDTSYWFGCFRNSYSCFMNRMDFTNYRRFEADSKVVFAK